MSVEMLRIGTRGSQLALWQANAVAGLLGGAGVRTELVVIKTTGDRIQDASLAETGGKRLFVKELEEALLRHEIDLAVHSAKDMPAVLPDGLVVAATLARDDPTDALVLAGHARASDLEAVRAMLGDEPALGTSSVRRAAQLVALFTRASFVPIRGNVDTRLRKLDAGGYDALVLASAGLHRLGFTARITARIPVERCVPAPGQGTVAIETRLDDQPTRRALEPLNDRGAEVSLIAERSLVQALGGGCHLPLGALALHHNGHLDMHAMVASPDGRRVVKRTARGSPAGAASLGQRLAEELARSGALEILDAVRHPSGNVESAS